MQYNEYKTTFLKIAKKCFIQVFFFVFLAILVPLALEDFRKMKFKNINRK